MTAKEIIDALDGGNFAAQIDALGPADAGAFGKQLAIGRFGQVTKRQAEVLAHGPAFAVVMQQLVEEGLAALPAMLTALQLAESPMVRFLLVSLLGEIDDHSARDALRQTLQNDPSEMVREMAASSLAAHADEADIATLLALLESPARVESAEIDETLDGDERIEASWRRLDQLARVGGPMDVRAGAARGLGRRREKRAVPALLTLLHDSSLLVQTAAIHALGSIRDPSAIRPLEELRAIHASDPAQRATLIVQSIDRALQRLRPAQSEES